MIEHVAVIEPQLAFVPSLTFKRPLLFFDRLYVPRLDKLFKSLSNAAVKKDPFPLTQEGFKQSLADLTWLFEQDIVFSNDIDLNERLEEIPSKIVRKSFCDTLKISDSSICSEYCYYNLSDAGKYEIQMRILLNTEALLLRIKA